MVRPVQEQQQQQERQPAERDRAEDGARLLALHRDRERLQNEASSLWQSFNAAVLAAGPHTMDLPGERSNKFDFVKQGLRMRRCAPLPKCVMVPASAPASVPCRASCQTARTMVCRICAPSLLLL